LVGDDISENSLSCNHAAIARITRITVTARNGLVWLEPLRNLGDDA